MAQRDNKKRLGKKHRQASTRPKKGRAPRVAPSDVGRVHVPGTRLIRQRGVARIVRRPSGEA